MNLIERLRGIEDTDGDTMLDAIEAGLFREAADEIERLEGVRDAAIPIADNGYAEESDITRLREALDKGQT